MPAKCLVNLVRRRLDDTEAEILYEEGKPEQREAPRIRLQANPTCCRAGINSAREETFLSGSIQRLTEGSMVFQKVSIKIKHHRRQFLT